MRGRMSRDDVYEETGSRRQGVASREADVVPAKLRPRTRKNWYSLIQSDVFSTAQYLSTSRSQFTRRNPAAGNGRYWGMSELSEGSSDEGKDELSLATHRHPLVLTPFTPDSITLVLVKLSCMGSSRARPSREPLSRLLTAPIFAGSRM